MNKELLRILGCPKDRSELDYVNGRLVCRECSTVYQVIDGIPRMLIKDYTCESSPESEKE